MLPAANSFQFMDEARKKLFLFIELALSRFRISPIYNVFTQSVVIIIAISYLLLCKLTWKEVTLYPYQRYHMTFWMAEKERIYGQSTKGYADPPGSYLCYLPSGFMSGTD